MRPVFARFRRVEEMKPITIIGGGLAGLTLGIGLRRQEVPVRIYEAGTYPRHRVCGEFISGRGVETLKRLDLIPSLFKSGARHARTAAFFSPEKRLTSFALPEPALCLARYDLDALLARQFVDAGGELIAGTRLGPKSEQEGCVRASGRALHPTTNGWRWFGLKAHATGVELSADLEMHFLPQGYVGVCRLDENRANVCGLFRNRAGQSAGDWKTQLAGVRGSPLFTKLSRAQWCEETFCAVSGLRYSPGPEREETECAIGDACSLIAPLTGNGMSQAFESAEIALPPLLSYAAGTCAWPETVDKVMTNAHAVFGKRWRWGKLLQDAVLHPLAMKYAMPLLLRAAWFPSRCYRLTR